MSALKKLISERLQNSRTVGMTIGEADSLADEIVQITPLIAAAPELLEELKRANKIIMNALNVMTLSQKDAWGMRNEEDGLLDDIGITRNRERELAIAKAEGRLEHAWQRHASMTVCKVCGLIKGSGKDKNSKCEGPRT